MLKDFTWRKTPRDIFSSLKMQSLMHTLKAPQKHAVALIYAQMYMDADNDGLVSVDAEEYAYAFALKGPEMVTEIEAILVSKGFVSDMGDGRFLIADFESAEIKKEKTESADERRERVAKKICSEKPSDCDKKRKNVAENAKNASDCDKNAKSVTEREEKRGEETRRDERRQEEIVENEVQSVLRVLESMPEDDKSVMCVQENKPAEDSHVSLAREDTQRETEISPALQKKLESLGVRLSNSQAVNVLVRFFNAHSAGINLWADELEVTSLALLVHKCRSLSEPKSPEDTVAREICGSFKQAVRQVESLHSVTCLPSQLLSGPVWAEVLSRVCAKLDPGLTSKKLFEAEIQKAQGEVT